VEKTLWFQVDGHALKGCDNQKALDVFRKTGQVVHLKIARPKIGAHFEPVSRRSGYCVLLIKVHLVHLPAVSKW
jgi:hypothetical protein